MNNNTTALQPKLAALLAQDAYGLKTSSQRSIFMLNYKDKFDIRERDKLDSTGGTELYINGGEQLRGQTGALIFVKTSHVMGMCAFGIGEYAGQAFIILKGTASLFDALTDLNAGIKRSDTGGQVHQGFQDTFETFRPQLIKFQAELAKRTGVNTIHCIGHSLGGALATLTADWLSANCEITVKLYTFGSPRVGLTYFANNFTNSINPENIYRVYHKTDPVPMVPTWPFIHVPDKGTDYLLDSGMPPWEYHYMENYLNSVSANGEVSLDWPTLKAKRPPALMDKSIENWLKSDGPLSLSINTVQVLNSALLWVIQKIVNISGIMLVGATTTTFTILDRLAYMMHKAYDFSKDLGFWVMRLITRMARILGIVMTETTSFTVAFIRMIFIRIHNGVSELVRKASQATE
ncbi:lipase family protein [Thalassolituus oleivorans]|uniref:lipase family protein n=1 Tax=Thalassolituus oleivorans TaxID=187493 RepID=UPI002408F51E|nr:lipase family protein [Thalassolituus oleivorans]MDF1641227.1 lipase family protein [Thalassolituus oleivorans]